MLRPRTRAALAAARERGLQRDRRHGTHVPGRAPLPHRARAGRLLPGRGRCRSGDGEFLRHVPIPLELAREAIEAIQDSGLRAQLLRRRRAVRRARDARGRALRELPAHRAARRRAAARVARAAADEARRRRRPERARRARRDAARAVRRPPVHREVAAVLPRARAPRRVEGIGPAVRRRPARLHAGATRSRSATARTTSS